MFIESDDPPAVPLWIGGHAYLTMAPEFVDIRNPADGRVLRRTPLCTADVADKALESARRASEVWRAWPESDRRVLLVRLAGEIERYAEHFCHLISEETGKPPVESRSEVEAALAVLREVEGMKGGGGVTVVAVACAAGMAMSVSLGLAAPGLLAGAVVVVKTDPSAPSALVALAELTGRCGFPPGVFNVIHGGDSMLSHFCGQPDVRTNVSARQEGA